LGRLMKCAFKIEGFKVVYLLRTAIKGQAVADFIVEFTYAEN